VNSKSFAKISIGACPAMKIGYVSSKASSIVSNLLSGRVLSRMKSMSKGVAEQQSRTRVSEGGRSGKKKSLTLPINYIICTAKVAVP